VWQRILSRHIIFQGIIPSNLLKEASAFLDPEPDGHTEINIISILDSENTWNIRIVHKNKEKYDIFIGRPSKWGNPFVIGKDGTREQVIAKYRKWILTQPKLIRDLSQLNGKTLGCWCSPKPCHGNVLKELAEKSLQQPHSK